MPPSERLRLATAAIHRQVEDGVDILRRTETREDAAQLLLRMEAFYRGLEPIIASHLVGQVSSEFLIPRVSGLQEDLDALSPGWKSLPVPPMPDLSDSLGALYVLEGATLGGQIITRHLHNRLGFQSQFFRSEGVGPRWRAFRQILDQTENYEAVEASAIATFLAFESAVVQEPAVA